MAVDLSDFVPTLRREVTPPGSTLFEDVGDEVFVGYLVDAFWEARLEGFIPNYTSDEEGIVTSPVSPIFPDLPREQATLVVIYAGIKILRNQLMNQGTSLHVKAGPVEYETSNSAGAIVEMLRQLNDAKKRYIEMAEAARDLTGVTLIDAYSVRQINPLSYGGMLATIYGEIGQIAGGS